MAWAEKYSLSFKDNRSIPWYVKIYEDGFTGDPSILQGAADPLIFNFANEGDDLFSPFRESRVKINVVSRRNFEYLPLYADDDFTYKIKIFKNDTSTLYWQGWLDSQKYEEEYDVAPSIITISGATGLALLDDIEYKDGSIHYDGRKLQSEIILDILDKIGYDEFKEYINIYPKYAAMGTADSPLDYVYVDTDVFKDKTCKEALTEILKTYNAAITQKDGIFQIYRPTDTFRDTMRGRWFTDPSTKTYTEYEPLQFLNRDACTSSFQHLAGGGHLSITPQAKKIELIQDYNHKRSWLDNDELYAETFDGSTFEGWTNTADAKPISHWLAGEVQGIGIQAAKSLNTTPNIKQTFGELSYKTGDICTIEYEYLLYNYHSGALANVGWFSRLYLTDGTTTYYANIVDGDEVKWTTTPGYMGTGSVSLEVGTTGWTKVSRKFYDGLPITGDLVFELVRPYSPSSTSVIGGLKNIRFFSDSTKITQKTTIKKTLFKTVKETVFAKEVAGPLRVQNTFIVDVSARTGSTLKYEYDLGDITSLDTSISNNMEQFAGGLSIFRTWDVSSFFGSPVTFSGIYATSSWNCEWDASTTMLNMLGEEIHRQYNRPRQFLQLPFIEKDDTSTSFNILGCLMDSKNEDRPFAVNRGDFNVKKRSWNLDLAEIIPYTVLERSYNFYATPTDVSFGGQGLPATQTIDVSANVSYTYTVSPAASWLTINKSVNYDLILSASENLGAARDTSIYLYPAEDLSTFIIAVHQDASITVVADSVDVDRVMLTFSGMGFPLGSDRVTVTSSGTWTTTLVNTGDGTNWASRNPTSGGNGETCAVTVTTYEGLGRSCILRFTCGSAQVDVMINQVG